MQRLGVMALAILLLGVFLYPTLYHYEEVHQNGNQYPIRINRITGTTELFTYQGWTEIPRTRP